MKPWTTPRFPRWPGPRGRSLTAAQAAAIVAVACGFVAHGDAEPASPTAARRGLDQAAAERYVRRLGSGAIADRDAAERGLIDLGTAVLPLVTAARSQATGEASHRLAGIQRLLETQADDEAIEPAIVTLEADETPAGDVLRQLFSQAGSRIDVEAAADRRISLRCHRLTFWEALDDLLDRSGLVLDFVAPAPSDGGALQPAAPVPQLRIVDAAGAAAMPAVAAGPLRVSIAGVERTGPAVPDADSSRGRGARITLRVAWEPRLEPLLVRLPNRSLVAEGPAGESMPVAQRAAVIEAVIPPRRPWIDLPILFAAPAVPLDRLGMLRGTVVLWLKGMEHAFCFAGVRADRDPVTPALPRPLRVGQAEVALLGAAVDDDRLQVRASVTYDAASEPLASHHSWLAARSLEAWLADGVQLDRRDQRVESRNDRGITVAAEFTLPADWSRRSAAERRELSITWPLPISIHEVPVDFALRDLPLPAPRPR